MTVECEFRIPYSLFRIPYSARHNRVPLVRANHAPQSAWCFEQHARKSLLFLTLN